MSQKIAKHSSMRKRLSALGCLAYLLLGSSETYASEFIMHDPSERPNIALDCRATRFVQSQLQQSTPFHLHVDVNFSEKYAVISPEIGRDKIFLALTSIATLPDQEPEYFVLTNGSASAIFNTQREDIVIVESTPSGSVDYVITAESCKTNLTN